jgi:hypothetical protein
MTEMRKIGRIWETFLYSEEFKLVSYICEDGKGGLFQFLISKRVHDRIEEDHDEILGHIVLWDYAEHSIRFLG